MIPARMPAERLQITLIDVEGQSASDELGLFRSFRHPVNDPDVIMSRLPLVTVADTCPLSLAAVVCG